jgi:hypothetical protein
LQRSKVVPQFDYLVGVGTGPALRFVHLYAILERGRASIQSLNFSREVDSEDFV